MAQQFDYPKTETQLREILDKLYQHSEEVYNAGGRPAFKGLLEIMTAETTIITAIHNIKSKEHRKAGLLVPCLQMSIWTLWTNG